MRRIIAILLMLALFTTAPGCERTKDKENESMKNPQVTFTMETGEKIVVELYPDKAPNTVNNFLSLVGKGFYDGLIFHRVIPGFMIQGGDPSGNGTGGPGYTIEGEFAKNGHKENDLVHDRGVLSMARRAPYNTAGCQFFIMVEKAPHLDKEYAAFGKVIEGMEVIDAIVATETNAQDKPLSDQKIKTATAETFGVDYPDPVTIKS